MNQQLIWNYPPEVSGLIVRYKSVNQAEKAAGLAQGTLGKIRNGKCAYTELTKQKVLTALDNFTRQQEDKFPMPIPHAVIPDNCPPLIADLIKHAGSKYQARRALSCSEATLKGIINGKAVLTPIWIERAKAALARAATLAPEGPARLQDTINTHPFAPKPELPEFVPWDRKSFQTVTIQNPGGKKTAYKKVPAPLAKLVEKYVTASEASRAMGKSSSLIQGWLTKPLNFDLRKQKLVHAALHGQPATAQQEMAEGFDEYRLDMAIVLTKAQNYDRIADIAEILNGKMLFKKSTGAGWILIYRIKGDDARRFKKLAMRDAQEIVCP